jgi:hypothetical protein
MGERHFTPSVRLHLVVLHILDLPVSVFESLAILAHKLRTGLVTGARRTAGCTPSTSRASPVTTEGSIDDGKVVLEELPWIAVGCWVVSHGLVPGVGQRGIVCDIVRDLIASEEVHGDARVIPLHRVDTSTSAIEGSAEAVLRGVVLHAAPHVSRLDRSAVRAAIEGADCVDDVRGYGTAGSGVDRNLVYGSTVGTLDNVDFTHVRPVGAVGPEGRPSGAPYGHVDGIKDEDTTIEDVAVVEADRLAIARDGWGGVDAQDGISGAVNLNELAVPSIVLVLVVDDTVGRIGE